ncbi:hypothetical protein [Nonomuraea typhae]|uniref:hypothetical protein n=1 Tax=Nonomuraea typhae TaxID=2603600 RepID=UPI0012F7BD90|nr:hypothetical protein [Nonomuraea typhae]
MRRTTFTAVALAAVMVATPFAVTAPASAAAKPNLRACYDGKCKITITKAVSFRVAPRYRLGRLRVSRVWSSTFSQYLVRVEAPGLTGTISEGGRGRLNSLDYRVLSITGKGATIRFEG